MENNKKKIFSLYKEKYAIIAPYLKEEKTQKFITIALSLFAFSFFGLFAINPTLSTISQLQTQLEENRKIDKNLDQKIRNLASLEQKYALITLDVPVANAALPQTPDVPLLVGEIHALGVASGVSLSRLQTFEVDLLKTVEGEKKSSSFAFSLEAGGEQANLMRFISSILNFQRIVSIDSLTINRRQSQEGPFHLSLRGRAYFKRQQ